MEMSLILLRGYTIVGKQIW